jgi:putative methionine-R-sulfoxide reductase with GAF domain
MLDQGTAPFPPNPGAQNTEIPPPFSFSEDRIEPLRFPGDDGGHSLTEMAKRDLDATLQLLAERAQYITGASGAAIALREGNEIICRASAGKSAPQLAARLDADSGLVAESVRTRQVLSCSDTNHDPRANRENCQAKGIVSVLVMPLLRLQEVAGVFELLSGQPNAFEEREVVVLERLGEMVQTAMDHSEAAQRAQSEIARGGNFALAGESEVGDDLSEKNESAVLPQRQASSEPAELPIQPVERGKIGNCSACGFPISEGRTLCLDCEKPLAAQVKPAGDPEFPEPASLLEFGESGRESESWLQTHKFLIAALLLVAAVVALLLYIS